MPIVTAGANVSSQALLDKPANIAGKGSSSVTNTWQFSSQRVGIHFIEKLMPNLALKIPVITVAGNSPFINTQGKLMERTVIQLWALTAEQNKIKATTSKYTNHLLFPASYNHIQ